MSFFPLPNRKIAMVQPRAGGGPGEDPKIVKGPARADGATSLLEVRRAPKWILGADVESRRSVTTCYCRRRILSITELAWYYPWRSGFQRIERSWSLVLLVSPLTAESELGDGQCRSAGESHWRDVSIRR